MVELSGKGGADLTVVHEHGQPVLFVHIIEHAFPAQLVEFIRGSIRRVQLSLGHDLADGLHGRPGSLKIAANVQMHMIDQDSVVQGTTMVILLQRRLQINQPCTLPGQGLGLLMDDTIDRAVRSKTQGIESPGPVNRVLASWTRPRARIHLPMQKDRSA